MNPPALRPLLRSLAAAAIVLQTAPHAADAGGTSAANLTLPRAAAASGAARFASTAPALAVVPKLQSVLDKKTAASAATSAGALSRAGFGRAPLTIASAVSEPGDVRVSDASRTPMPGNYVLRMTSTSLAIPSGSTANPYTATISVPDCGVDASTPANLFRWDDAPAVLPQITQFPATAGTYYGVFFLATETIPTMPIGAGAHQATISLSGLSAQLTPFQMAVTGFPTPKAFEPAVDSAAPFITNAAFGARTDDSTFDRPQVTRINSSDTAVTGTDTFGRGVALGAGYTATASVVSASSIADLGGDTAPDNQYRGAVATSPSGGRLQTAVAWHIGPGELLTYRVRWTFTGPDGQRPTDALPLAGPCDR